MAQTEDTELRDLVIEALEKNGSLAKIRALLRANVFLAFEDDFDNIRQNASLDNVLKLPEGILALSVVHEFLEFCNLKNTLFVYMSESRQGKEYNYEGKHYLNEKLNLYKQDVREPILITLIKLFNQSKYFDQHGNGESRKQVKLASNYRDDENCTYIVHEDSQGSTTSNSQSDNMSDDKNKLHLRLQLDNSDTDTSSDSAREKSRSEYIPSEHFKRSDKNVIQHTSKEHSDMVHDKRSDIITHKKEQNILHDTLKDLKITNSSSDSTSYVELKPYNDFDGKILNTENVTVVKKQDNKNNSPRSSTKNNSHSKSIEGAKSASSSNASSLSFKDEQIKSNKDHTSPQASIKSDVDTAEYSYDFASSPSLKNIDKPKLTKADSTSHTLETVEGKYSPNKNLSVESQQHSSHSSVSISDVADLISDKSSSAGNQSRNDKSTDHKSSLSSRHSKKKSQSHQSKIMSDDSGDFTESPVPSLSNLSLDIHSD
ncbi:hypothetical protein O3G_MSEX005034 [Manduca sexta]|uniref:LisH domain-containing protein n=1 Tax=Manduca sexta TaxID=7130 RepID=A0A921YY87_MANSE|nr:hypothetical protein O3G_MSEX005034 [Manduca sexta]